MRIAWLFGVFLLWPQPGRAALGRAAGNPPRAWSRLPGFDQDLTVVNFPLPVHASPGLLDVRDAVPAYVPRVPKAGSPLTQRAKRRRAPPAQAAAAPIPAPDSPTPEPPRPGMEFEALGEDMRDAPAAPPSGDWFLAAIRNPDPQRRCAAMETFGYPGNFAAIPYISAVLLRFDEPLFVRVSAARALGRINDRRAWNFLARAVADREPQVRLAGAIALSHIAGRGGASALVRALRGEGDEDVRAALSWALAVARARRF